MKKGRIILALIASFSLMTLPAIAQNNHNVAVAVQAGTLGAGLEGIVGINDYLDGRIGANALYFDFKDHKIKGNNYNFDVNWRNYNALLDVRPFANSFHLTGGVVYNDHKIKIKSSEQSFNFGGTTYTSDQVGSLSGNVDFNNWAPYLGIGWSKPLAKQTGNWSLMVDLGAMYIGKPDVSLSANGPIASDTAFQSNLASAEKEIRDRADNYRFYPVAMVGLSYRF